MIKNAPNASIMITSNWEKMNEVHQLEKKSDLTGKNKIIGIVKFVFILYISGNWSTGKYLQNNSLIS